MRISSKITDSNISVVLNPVRVDPLEPESVVVVTVGSSVVVVIVVVVVVIVVVVVVGAKVGGSNS